MDTQIKFDDTTLGFVFWYRNLNDAVTEVHQREDGEWYQAPISNAIDCITHYRIGRWLGPARWTTKDVLLYLGLKTEEAHFLPFKS